MLKSTSGAYALGIGHFFKSPGQSLSFVFTFPKHSFFWSAQDVQNLYEAGAQFMEMFTRYNFPMTQVGRKPLFEWRLESEISKMSPNWYYVQHVPTAEDTSKRPTFGSSHKECPTNGPKAKAGCVWNRKQQKWDFPK